VVTDSFAHQVRIDQIRDGELFELAADEAECASIAQLLGLQGIKRLEARAMLYRKGQVIHAEGRVLASLDQNCVITGEPLPAHVDEPFELVFMPEPEVSRSEEEVELGKADCDVVFHDGSTIDLGAAIADTLALALDPFPRSAGADAALKEAGVLTEGEASPFAVLAHLWDGPDRS
jgi:uncharacterized metal-binding protein YceD (DUF177 family)